MTASTVDTAQVVVEPVRYWSRERKVGVGLAAAGVIAAVLFGALASAQKAEFTLAETISGSAVGVNGRVGAILFGAIAAVAGAAMLVTARRAFGWLLGLGIVAALISFLCWQLSQAPDNLNTIPLGSVARSSVTLALPLVLGALAGVLCERSAVINVAIEGQFLMGAFAAAMFATLAGSVWIGILAAGIGGLLIGLLLAVLAIRFLVDQVVLGVVLNVFALGLTGFLYEQLMAKDQTRFNQPSFVPEWDIPGLSKIPLLGPALFKGNIFLYGAIVLVIVIHVGLFYTRWGLRTRAVGEHPAAADTLGVKVLAVRYRNVLIGGVVAGFGGAYFTLLSTTNFNKNMTSGLGFVALAALIFGRWSPIGSMLAALFFGFCSALAVSLGSINSPIPSGFLNMLPYIATIVAVAGLVGRVRAPAADGTPYIKG
ncbi:ABC transporter permease [Asanoa sp. NPDC049573]|uniref:ABC transporter permease n=1 Tax=Asanoa sp. NPDC049573 TaxID=3155396 RepID=UPI0034402990